jgi:hypothetical protein
LRFRKQLLTSADNHIETTSNNVVFEWHRITSIMSSPRIQIALRQPPTKEEEEEEADGEEEYDSPSKWRQKLQQQPLSSSSSSVWNSLQTRSLDFAINVECE